MTPVAPHIANDVSYVTRIKQANHFVWQVQYLGKLKCDFLWQAGAALGDVQVSLFLAGA